MTEEWVWPALISAVGVIILIGLACETYALLTGKTTFSAYVWNKYKDDPYALFVAGMVIGLIIGTLATHFFWHWCPEDGRGIGWCPEEGRGIG
jgi:hypothetical protein